MSRWLTRVLHSDGVLALVTVGLTTLAFYPARLWMTRVHWAMLYLLIIAMLARVRGTRAAVVAALLAFLLWDYFILTPSFNLVLLDDQGWVALFGLLVVGVIIGVQTGNLRRREAVALARERETASLNRLSAVLMRITTIEAMTATILPELCGSLETDDAFLSVRDRGTDSLQLWRLPSRTTATIDPKVLAQAQWVLDHRVPLGVVNSPAMAPHPSEYGRRAPVDPGARAAHGLFLPITQGMALDGVLYVAGHPHGTAYALQQIQWVMAVANLVSLFLERQHLEAAAYAADALREADRLKSTVISSVSHGLKTPLAVINATVTNLLAQDVTWPPAQLRRELETMHEAADRLSANIGALMDLARLESDAWEVHRDRYELVEVIGAAVAAFDRAQRARLVFAIPDELPLLYLDFHQMARALHHLLENALLYAPDSTPVTIGASASGAEVCVWVEDAGPGIPPAEQGRVFDKFFRGAGAAAQVPTGTGLGLAITAEIIRRHQGRIRGESVEPHGARFLITLPRPAQEERPA